MPDITENIACGGVQRRSELTKEKILQAAEEEFSAKGIFGTRVDEISKRAGVNKRMMYIYFGNKEDLYTAVLERVFARLSEFYGDLTSETTVSDAVIKYFNFLKSNPNFVKLSIWENMNDSYYFSRCRASDFEKKALNALTKCFEENKKSGVCREDLNCRELAVAVKSLCISSFSNSRAGEYASGGTMNGASVINADENVICRMVKAYVV